MELPHKTIQLPCRARFTEQQSIESKDLQHLNLTAQQGQYNFVYANGLISAQRRNLDKGEDLLKFKAYGEDEVSTWKVTKVMESYPDWVKVLVHRVTLWTKQST